MDRNKIKSVAKGSEASALEKQVGYCIASINGKIKGFDEELKNTDNLELDIEIYKGTYIFCMYNIYIVCLYII